MPDIHLPDGSTLHMAEGTSPEAMTAAVRQYGDQQAAAAQERSSPWNSIKKTATDYGKGILDHLDPRTQGKNLLHTLLTDSPDPFSAITGSMVKGVSSAVAHPVDTYNTLSDPTKGGNATGDLLFALLTGRAGGLVSKALRPANLGSTLEAGSELIPKKVFGTDLPVRDVVQKVATKLQAPEANIPGFDRYAPNTGSAPVNRAALTSRVPYGDADAAATEALKANGGLSAADVASMRERYPGVSDEFLQKVADAEKAKQGQPAATLSKVSKSLGGGEPPIEPAEPAPVAASPKPQSPSGSGGAIPDFIQSELHSGYNNGHVIPEGMAPTERLAQASSGLETPNTGKYYDADYGGVLDEPGQFEFEGGPDTGGRLSREGQDVPSAGDVDSLIKSMPETPVASRLNAATQSLGAEPTHIGSSPTPSGMPNYTDWAQGMDDIINAASEEDMPNAASSGLARSRPTNAIKDWMTKLQQTSGRGWPFSEIQP